MSFQWPDPISFVADIFTLLGIPILSYSTWSLFKQFKKAREPQSVSHGCLQFSDVKRDVALNLVPLSEVTAIPRMGDRVILPGEIRGSENPGGGIYDVECVVFAYIPAPEVEQPCPALPSKIIVYVHDAKIEGVVS